MVKTSKSKAKKKKATKAAKPSNTNKKSSNKKATAKKATIAKKVVIDREPIINTPTEHLDKRLLLPQLLVAKCMGISTQGFQKWDLSPRVREGRQALYYLPDVIAYKVRQASGDSSTTFKMNEEMSRLTYHKANIEELKEQQLRDDLFTAADVVLLCSALYGAVRSKVLAIHSKFAVKYPDSETEYIEEIEDLSIDCLNELGTDGIPSSIRNRVLASSKRNEGPAEANGQRVGK